MFCVLKPFVIGALKRTAKISLFKHLCKCDLYHSIKASEMEGANHTDRSIKTSGCRKFYEIPNEFNYKTVHRNVKHDESFLKYVYENIAGHNATFQGPYGRRQVVYCDYTASGQPLQFIENFIQNEVMPFYGNTHTTTTVTSLQSTLFRHEAKDIIRNTVNASEHDAILFVGTGCTSAVNHFIHSLNMKNLPVVFVGPFEHHSNLLPWREIGAKVVRISETPEGLLDVHYLEEKLKEYCKQGQQLIGSFSAASNITGILTETNKITVLLHKYGALSLWDYAAAGPYVDIDMNPVVIGDQQGLTYKDAVFLSPHKFVGGPDTPGVLIAKKNLFRNPVPSEPGGGTVFFVSRESHRYLQEIEMREEGGTPSIIGAIRAGMAFQLKNAIGTKLILQREEEICRNVFGAWSRLQNLKILGSTSAHRLSIFSFVVLHESSGLYLHHNFVCALLNDLFGIQSRGGCACSGPYALDLLGINEPLAQHFDELLVENKTLDRVHLRRYREYSDREVLRPGFVRLNIPYFMSEEDMKYVIEAVIIVANEGWKLLPQYMFNPETGEWKHKTHQVFNDRKWLGSISYSSGFFSYQHSKETIDPPPNNRLECLEKAKEIFRNSIKAAKRVSLADQELIFDSEAAKIRWFLLPNEAKSYLLGERTMPIKVLPFKVREKSEPVSSTNGNCDLSLDLSSLNFLTSKNVVNKIPDNLQNSEGAYFNIRKDLRLPLADSVIHSGTANANKSYLECSVSGQCQLAEPVTLNKCKWHKPHNKIFAPFLKAVSDFKMIHDGDRVLVCLSGGKDSLSLLHTLRQYQFYARKKGISFQLGAMTVDPKSPSYDPSPLKVYLAALGVPYFYEEQAILKQAAELPECRSICSFCSRMKRGRIYACAHSQNYNVVALGQHLDDLAESFLMSVFHNGLLGTMKASYTIQKGTLRLIRPFVYVREKELRIFAEQKKLPVITENCPACFEAPKERHRVKQLLAAQEILFPFLYQNLKHAMYPLMAINCIGVDGSTLGQEVQANLQNSEENEKGEFDIS